VKAVAPGDLVLIRWLDIQSDESGDPDESDLWEWEQPAYFVAWGVKRDVPTATFRYAHGSEDQSQSGSLCIPAALILEMRLLRAGAVVYRRGKR